MPAEKIYDKKFVIVIDDETLNKVRKLAKIQKISMNEISRKSLKIYITKNKKLLEKNEKNHKKG